MKSPLKLKTKDLPSKLLCLVLKLKITFFIFRIYIRVTAFFHYLGWLSVPERAVRTLIIPISAKITRWQSASQDFYNSFANQKTLVDQYNKCLGQNQDSDVADARLKDLEKENSEIRKQLNFFSSSKFYGR